MSQGPDFIGVGVAKSGTTWVAARLAEHPQVYLPEKQISFWTSNFPRGYDWYDGRFKDRGDRIAGEFSPQYWVSPRPHSTRVEHYPRWSLRSLWNHLNRPYPSARDEIKKRYPGVKILAVFRNPADRAWSQYSKWVEGREKRGKHSLVVPFERMFRDDGRWIRCVGNYAAVLKHWRDAFPDMGVFLYDDLVAQPQGFMASIYRFLGVDDSFVGHLEKREHARKYEPMNPAVRRMVLEFYEREIREFFQLIGRELDWLDCLRAST